MNIDVNDENAEKLHDISLEMDDYGNGVIVIECKATLITKRLMFKDLVVGENFHCDCGTDIKFNTEEIHDMQFELDKLFNN